MGSIILEALDQVAVITIDNPPLNALNRDLVEELGRAFDQVSASGVRAVVLTGAGEKAFVAGADISQFPALKEDTGAAFVRHGQGVYQKIDAFPLPVICAVNGYALGGGCELALACDIRVAAENAKFGLSEVTLGILPGYGGTQRLPRLVGKGMAKKLILTGEPISAQEAHRIGLAEVLAPKRGALEAALGLARRIAGACAPVSVQEALRTIDEGCAVSLAEGIELEALAFGRLCETADKAEGVAAFFEKRSPRFQGT